LTKVNVITLLSHIFFPIHRSIGPLDQETHFVDLGVEPTPLPQIITPAVTEI